MHHTAVQESLRASNSQLVETMSAVAKVGNIIAQMRTTTVPMNVDKENVHSSFSVAQGGGMVHTPSHIEQKESGFVLSRGVAVNMPMTPLPKKKSAFAYTWFFCIVCAKDGIFIFIWRKFASKGA